MKELKLTQHEAMQVESIRRHLNWLVVRMQNFDIRAEVVRNAVAGWLTAYQLKEPKK